MVDAQPHEVTPTLAEAAEFFKRESRIQYERVASEIEFQDAIERHRSEGRQLACVTNAGLPHGHYRLTFIPNGAITAH